VMKHDIALKMLGTGGRSNLFAVDHILGREG